MCKQTTYLQFLFEAKVGWENPNILNTALYVASNTVVLLPVYFCLLVFLFWPYTLSYLFFHVCLLCCCCLMKKGSPPRFLQVKQQSFWGILLIWRLKIFFFCKFWATIIFFLKVTSETFFKDLITCWKEHGSFGKQWIVKSRSQMNRK